MLAYDICKKRITHKLYIAVDITTVYMLYLSEMFKFFLGFLTK